MELIGSIQYHLSDQINPSLRSVKWWIIIAIPYKRTID